MRFVDGPRAAMAAATLVCLAGSLAGFSESALAVDAASRPATGAEELGPPVALEMELGEGSASPIQLVGSEDRRQLVVTGRFANGQLRDLTRSVAYRCEPAGVVSVDSQGFVSTLSNGRSVITALDSSGQSASLEVSVDRFGNDPAVEFSEEIVPIFTKLGCNGGGCHGKSSGQNGFRLSLLGFEPPEDYEHLLKEARGRRLFPAAPDESLLLRKATGSVPHGGGQRMEVGDANYRLLRRWIAEGAGYGDPEARRLERIELFPTERMMVPRGEQQLAVLAHYSDGSVRDVTRTAQYEPNVAEMAEVSPSGHVTVLDLTGDVAVMVRYQSNVAVFRATIPLGAPVDGLPAPQNFIDELVFEKLKLLGLPPSALADDATFLRRVTIDVAGRLPSVDEAARFLADTAPDKRDRWIEQLLDSRDYASHFAGKWAAILRNKRQSDDQKHGSFAFHDWIRAAIYENMPYDRFVRAIIAAAGDPSRHPPVVWYREVEEINEQVEDTAQLFLGQRIQCARCHHHPFEKWSQHDYYGFAAFFSRVGRKPGALPAETRIFHQRGTPSAVHPKTHQSIVPAGLGGNPPQLAAEDDPRHALVDWMVAPQNPYFARALVNRYWKHFFGRGLVEPEDDLRATNPATNPQLLDALAGHFTDSGYDLKELVRTICRSRTYQLHSEPNNYNLEDRQNFSRYYPKRLHAEVLLDAIDRVTSSSTSFPGLPAGTRAIELPDSGFPSYFLTVFGRPEANSACECERQSEANLAQGLHLINSPEIHAKLSADTGRAAQLAAAAERNHEDRVRELYLSALSREPTPGELETIQKYLAEKQGENGENLRPAYEDIVWSIVNTKEFLFNH